MNKWIHYFIGDTEGNNKWLGQYPGNRDEAQRSYCDCKCSFKDLKNTNPNCVYITLDNIQQDNRRKQNDNNGGKQYFKSVSRYDIKNAFLQRFMPLSGNVHGSFRMMPPELLHTSGSGLIMYMFESLHLHLGGGIEAQNNIMGNIMFKGCEPPKITLIRNTLLSPILFRDKVSVIFHVD